MRDWLSLLSKSEALMFAKLGLDFNERVETTIAAARDTILSESANAMLKQLRAANLSEIALFDLLDSAQATVDKSTGKIV